MFLRASMPKECDSPHAACYTHGPSVHVKTCLNPHDLTSFFPHFTGSFVEDSAEDLVKILSSMAAVKCGVVGVDSE